MDTTEEIEEEKQEVFVNDWLSTKSTLGIKGRLLFIEKYEIPMGDTDRRQSDTERFTRGTSPPWKPIEIQLVYGRNPDDGGRQYRPTMRFVEDDEALRAEAREYEICSLAHPDGKLLNYRKADFVFTIDTHDQYVGGILHKYCARAFVVITSTFHRNRMMEFFAQYLSIKHLVLPKEQDKRTYEITPLDGAEYRSDETTEPEQDPGEAARYREMLRQMGARVTVIAESAKYS